MDVEHCYMPIRASYSTFHLPFFFLLLFLSSWNLWEWWHVWSDSYFSRQSCGQREWQAPVHCEVGHWDLTGCAVFVGGDAPWCVVTMPSAYIMKCRGLLFFFCMRIGLISGSALPAGHSRQFVPKFFWQQGPVEMPDSMRTLSSILCLLYGWGSVLQSI